MKTKVDHMYYEYNGEGWFNNYDQNEHVCDYWAWRIALYDIRASRYNVPKSASRL